MNNGKIFYFHNYVEAKHSNGGADLSQEYPEVTAEKPLLGSAIWKESGFSEKIPPIVLRDYMVREFVITCNGANRLDILCKVFRKIYDMDLDSLSAFFRFPVEFFKAIEDGEFPDDAEDFVDAVAGFLLLRNADRIQELGGEDCPDFKDDVLNLWERLCVVWDELLLADFSELEAQTREAIIASGKVYVG